MLSSLDPIRPRSLRHGIGSASLLALCVFASGCRGDTPAPAAPLPTSLTDSLLFHLITTYGAEVTDSIGTVRQASFLGNGSHVAVLDKLSPHLLLFASEGRFLWQGGRRGDGPSELRSPSALATKADTVVVTQGGALKTWVLEGDSLRFVRTQPLPASFVPLDAEFLCGGPLLLYGRDNTQFLRNPHATSSPSPAMHWLFFVKPDSDGSLQLDPRWSEPRDPSGLGVIGLYGEHLDGTSEGVVLLHRAHPWAPGRILEFDCDLRQLRSRPEAHLIHGDSVPALDPRKYPLQWSCGVIAIPGGFVAPIERPTHPRRATTEYQRDTYSRTEFFWFANGNPEGSVLIARNWRTQDYHPEVGALLSTHEPFPHFLIVPPQAFRPPQGGQ